MEPLNSPGSSSGATTLERPPTQGSAASTGQAPLKEALPAAKETIREATQALKNGSSETLQTARQAGDDYLCEQKDRLAGKLDEYTTALDAACESLRQEERNPLAGPANRAARGLEQAANYLRGTSRVGVMNDLGDLARKRPEWIYGAIFVAGLATARFLKATPRQGPAAEGHGNPGAGPDRFQGRPLEVGTTPGQPYSSIEP